MSHEYLLWVATFAYGIHMIEETVYNWLDWVGYALHIKAKWSEFYMVNAVVIVMGACCAMVGWHNPTFALIFPAFMLVNAILFHILPVIVTRTFSPGFITSVFLFIPITYFIYNGAYLDGVIISESVLWISGILGFLAMMFPIFLQKTKRSWFVKKYLAE